MVEYIDPWEIGEEYPPAPLGEEPEVPQDSVSAFEPSVKNRRMKRLAAMAGATSLSLLVAPILHETSHALANHKFVPSAKELKKQQDDARLIFVLSGVNRA